MKTIEMKSKWIKDVERIRGPRISRHNFLRLDKNEKVNSFQKKFFFSAIKKINSNHLTAYPEVENLYKLIAKKNKVKVDNLVITAGSDQAIKHCFELFVKKNDKIITLNPTFAMVDIYAKLFRAKQLKIGYNRELSLNLKNLFLSIKKNISLIIIANPNSPTGTILKIDEIKKILNKAKKFQIPVLIDEAYHGFSKSNCIPLINNYTNLIVTRTFSKSFGLAGCRIGYIASSTKIAKLLFKLKPMYEVNSLALLFAEEALKNNLDTKYSYETLQGKLALVNFLKNKNINNLNTYANFIHIDFGEKRNKAINIFNKNKILIKGGHGVKGCENFLRITLGPRKYMMKVISLIKKII